MTQTVFVTGATGYIAQFIIKLLLEEDYKVIGTVRTKEKGDKLIKAYNNPNFSYEIVKDLANSKEDFDNALKAHPEIEIVLHTASPVFPTDLKDVEQDMILPAIHGTKNVLNSVGEFGKKVKRFVYTSSNAAIHSNNREGPTFVEDEDSWNDVEWVKGSNIEPRKGYQISKTYAEKAVWEFAKDSKIQFSTVNPVFVFGPQLFDDTVHQLNFSSDLVGSLVESSGNDYKKYEGTFIDVRDVAKAHIYAFQRENTVGKRLYLKEKPMTEQTVLDIINSKFPELEGKIPKGIPGSDKDILSKRVIGDNSKTRGILGFDFISIEQSVFDTIEQVIRVKGIK